MELRRRRRRRRCSRGQQPSEKLLKMMIFDKFLFIAGKCAMKDKMVVKVVVEL